MEQSLLARLEPLLDQWGTAATPDIPQSEAQALATSNNNLAVVASALSDREAQTEWFLAASRLDRMHLLYNLTRSAPWLEAVLDHLDIQRMMELKEPQMGAQREELNTVGPRTVRGF